MSEHLRSFYPVVMVRDVASTASFFTTHLGFETTFESDWYVGLRRGAFELGVLLFDHPSVPEAHRNPVSGMLLNLEVDDVDAVYRRLVTEGGLPLAQDIRDEDFGQRHVIIAGPEGVLIDVIQEIEPSPEFAAAYT